MRRQVFAGLTQMLQHATRRNPELLVGLGHGGLIAAFAALPMVTEAACRSCATPMEVMREYRETWANVRAIVVINPVVLPQRTDLGAVQRALPEVSRLQPASVPPRDPRFEGLPEWGLREGSRWADRGPGE